MQRTSQAVHGSAEGQVGVGQGAAHQVAGVGADVASFVVAVAAETHDIKSLWSNHSHVLGAKQRTCGAT